MKNVPFVIIVLVLSLTSALGQTINYDWLMVKPLNEITELPDDISQTKSIGVVISPTRDKGELLAREFHPIFVKSGIDPVSYYHVDDLMANPFIAQELANEFTKREIKYLVVINYINSNYELVIVPFNGSFDFIDPSKGAWKSESTEIKSISRTLYGQAHALARRNFLIVDVPEFRSLSARLKGQRFEAYKPDLRNETLYIPLFQPIEIDSTIKYTQKTLLAINNYNRRIEEKNRMLKAQFVNYPYPYAFLTMLSSEDELLKQNVRYLLKHVHTTNEDIRSFLNYKEKTNGVTEHITVTIKNGQGAIKRIAATAPVYKFYIQHLPSNSFYLGTKWDADLTWPEALQNHIQLLVQEIGN